MTSIQLLDVHTDSNNPEIELQNLKCFLDQLLDGSSLRAKNEEFMENNGGQTLFEKCYAVLNNDVKCEYNVHTQEYKIQKSHEYCENKCFEVVETMLMEFVEIDDIKVQTSIETVLRMHNEMNREVLLGYLTFFWKINSTNYEHYKVVLSETSVLARMSIMLKEEKSSTDEFFALVGQYILNCVKYDGKVDRRKKMNTRVGFLLALAIKYNQKMAMERIINCDVYNIGIVMKLCNELLVPRGNYINLISICMKKQTSRTHDLLNTIDIYSLKEYLDSLITKPRRHAIKIDYDFPQNICSILNYSHLKNLITHPVMSTYLHIQSQKFRRYNEWNFWVFICLFMFPFFGLLTFYDTMPEYAFSIVYCICLVATILLTIRESLQLIKDMSIRNYLRNITNWMETLMILLAWYILNAIQIQSNANFKQKNSLLSAVLILLATIDILSMLPYRWMSKYMFMLKHVSKTFLKILLIFLMVIFAFASCFRIVLAPAVESLLVFNNTNESIPADDEEEEDEIFLNFADFSTSFMKTIQMLSGEFTIEPFTLNSWEKKLMFLTFVLTSYVLFNLILGLVVSDIQQVKEETELLQLEEMKSKIVYGEERDKAGRINSGPACSGFKWLRHKMYQFRDYFILQYPHLNDMKHVFVDLLAHDVTYYYDGQQDPILKTYSGSHHEFKLSEELIAKFKTIVKGSERDLTALNVELMKINDNQKTQIIQQQKKIIKLMEKIEKSTN